MPPATKQQYDEESALLSNNDLNGQRYQKFEGNSFIENIQGQMEDMKQDVQEIVVGRDRGPKRDLSYDQSNHILVLLRMYGSVWPQVLPFCLANMFWTLAISLLTKYTPLDLTLHSTAAHTFMSTLVSFLVVSRSNITYQRFMQARSGLDEMYCACREAVELAALYSTYIDCDGAKQWRHDLAYETIVLLRTAMSAVEYQSKDIPSDVDCQQSDVNWCPHDKYISDFYHSERNPVDEIFRAPVVLAQKVREQVVKQRLKKYLKGKLSVSEENNILGKISSFVKAFQGIKKLMTTPFPFPLVQMTRWFLFAWVFTLPMVLTDSMKYTIETMIVVFFVTYGFLGIEYVVRVMRSRRK